MAQWYRGEGVCSGGHGLALAGLLAEALGGGIERRPGAWIVVGRIVDEVCVGHRTGQWRVGDGSGVWGVGRHEAEVDEVRVEVRGRKLLGGRSQNNSITSVSAATWWGTRAASLPRSSLPSMAKFVGGAGVLYGVPDLELEVARVLLDRRPAALHANRMSFNFFRANTRLRSVRPASRRSWYRSISRLSRWGPPARRRTWRFKISVVIVGPRVHRR